MLGFISAIGELVILLREIFEWVKEISKDDPKQFIKEAHQAMEKARTAKSPREKLEAVKALQRLLE